MNYDSSRSHTIFKSLLSFFLSLLIRCFSSPPGSPSSSSRRTPVSSSHHSEFLHDLHQKLEHLLCLPTRLVALQDQSTLQPLSPNLQHPPARSALPLPETLLPRPNRHLAVVSSFWSTHHISFPSLTALTFFSVCLSFSLSVSVSVSLSVSPCLFLSLAGGSGRIRISSSHQL
jgi:hypothetical protein